MFTKLANKTNYQRADRHKNSIEFIVVHYTANNGDTARNNLDYYSRVGGLEASAHYYVDENEVCCSVPWYDVAWHCGSKKGYRHPRCRNFNSIGVEMCSRIDSNGKYYIHEKTLERAWDFIAQLMEDFKVPIDRVVRHYDVTGKLCPRPYVDEKAWAGFKSKLMEKGEVEMTRYKTFDDIPKGYQSEIKEMMDAGVLKGKNGGVLDLTEDMIRCLIISWRMTKK